MVTACGNINMMMLSVRRTNKCNFLEGVSSVSVIFVALTIKIFLTKKYLLHIHLLKPGLKKNICNIFSPSPQHFLVVWFFLQAGNMYDALSAPQPCMFLPFCLKFGKRNNNEYHTDGQKLTRTRLCANHNICAVTPVRRERLVIFPFLICG